jgi:serine/threonine protein kinase/tetratricopeptide (TPR) repeat protein
MTDTADRAARWRRAQDIFHAALEHDEPERQHYLDEACGSDTALRSEVASLLEHADSGLLGDLDDDLSPVEPEADRIGSFRILRPLGHGGMGSVYLAEREGAGFTQRVALKLLRAGMLLSARVAPQLEERFNRERHILARLEHSGIARLIDGGYTPAGQPYLAMEFVEGIPLTEYAHEHGLGIRARVELFIAVCEAVQYAHQRLVIHRDLKPSNILVDETGRPKLLDFGIATFAETEDAVAAQTGSRTGLWFTPNYASPEQVRRERVTTLSDLYSLGVVLYELLADVRPYEAGSLSPGGLEEIVCRRIPERPSAQAATPRLARLLRGDLDTIVLKALAKEPERRYGSVRELADDLHRHLRREPVQARPDSFSYRLSTFLRRNRTAVAAAVFVLVALSAGLVTTTWQARNAERARAVAEDARGQAEEVADFLIGIFEENDPQQAPVDPALATAILERGVARADELAEQPAVRARLLDALGMVFLNLGRYDEAHQLVSQGLAIRMGTLGNAHPDVAESLRHLGRVMRARGQYAAAETVYRQALDIQRRVLDPDAAATAQTLSDIAFLLPYLGRAAEAESAYREVLAMRRRSLDPDDPAIGDAVLRVAAILRRQGRNAQAESVGREGIAFRERVLGPDHPDVGAALIAVADYVAEDSTRRDEAERMYRQGLDIQHRALGNRHLDLQHGMGSLADLLAAAGRYDEADSLLHELLDLREQLLGPDHESVGAIKEALGEVRAAQGRLDEAIALRTEGLAAWRRAMGRSHPAVASSLDGLARLYVLAGNDVAAESLLVEALEIRRGANGPRHPLVGILLISLGELNTRRAHYEEAERQLVEAREILEAQMTPDHPDPRRARAALAALYEAWGKPERAAAIREGHLDP